MSVEIYVWLPKWSGNIGHAAMWVDGGSPAGVMYLSRWPGSLISVLFGGGADLRYDDDVAAEGGQPYVTRFNRLDETAIKTAITRCHTANLYSFLALNCATQVRMCFDAGRSSSPLLDAALNLLEQPAGYALNLSKANTPWTLWAYAQTQLPEYG